jgi:hypothetical protein
MSPSLIQSFVFAWLVQIGADWLINKTILRQPDRKNGKGKRNKVERETRKNKETGIFISHRL